VLTFPQAAFLLLLLRHFQAFLAPQPLHALVGDLPAFAPQVFGRRAIARPRLAPAEGVEPLSQTLFFGHSLGV
jgi:hypothetical protein